MSFAYAGVNWEGRKWRTSLAITTLCKKLELDRGSPGGTFVVDGTVAGRQHDINNPTSDHHPDVNGIVRACDFGGNQPWLSDFTESIRLGQDRRIKYVIHNQRMFSSYKGPKNSEPPFTWRPYSGYNAHLTHTHVSVLTSADNDGAPWVLRGEEEVAQFTDEIAQRLNRIATADHVNKTGEGGVFQKDWQEAIEQNVMTVDSDPTDLVSKQEFAAFINRILRAIEVNADDDTQRELDALKALLRSV